MVDWSSDLAQPAFHGSIITPKFQIVNAHYLSTPFATPGTKRALQKTVRSQTSLFTHTGGVRVASAFLSWPYTFKPGSLPFP